MNKYLFYNKKTAAFILLAAVLLLLGCSISAEAYSQTLERHGIKAAAEGAMIKNITEKITVVKCIMPHSRIVLQNTGSVPADFELKIKNISPKLYEIAASSQNITGTGANWRSYRISLKAGESIDFKIKPRQQNFENYTFAVLGDSRWRTALHQKILGEIAKSDALFAINLGDIVNYGTLQEYQAFMMEVSDFPLPYYIVPGNHEIIDKKGVDLFLKYISPIDYHFDLGRFRFVLLDSSRQAVNPKQFQWLEEVFSTPLNSFLFHHVPPFSPTPRRPKHIIASPQEADRLIKLLEDKKVKAMFGAHIHAYLRTERNGVDYIIAGCAGAYPVIPPEEGGYPHYLLVDVKGDSYTVRVFRVDP